MSLSIDPDVPAGPQQISSPPTVLSVLLEAPDRLLTIIYIYIYLYIENYTAHRLVAGSLPTVWQYKSLAGLL